MQKEKTELEARALDLGERVLKFLKTPIPPKGWDPMASRLHQSVRHELIKEIEQLTKQVKSR